MEVEDVVKQLDRIFEAITRYNDSSRYFDFVKEYILFISEEESHIPKAIQNLYKKSELGFDDIYTICIEYNLYKGSKKDDTNHYVPYFLDKAFAKEINYWERSYKEIKDEYVRCKDNNYLKSIALTVETGKETFVFDIEKLHIKLIRELQGDTDQLLSIKNGHIVKGDEILPIEFEDTLMNVIIRELGKVKKGKYLTYDEIAENNQVEYGDEFRDKMYQASRRINNKILLIGKVDKFLEYNTKKVRVNPQK